MATIKQSIQRGSTPAQLFTFADVYHSPCGSTKSIDSFSKRLFPEDPRKRRTRNGNKSGPQQFTNLCPINKSWPMIIRHTHTDCIDKICSHLSGHLLTAFDLLSRAVLGPVLTWLWFVYMPQAVARSIIIQFDILLHVCKRPSTTWRIRNAKRVREKKPFCSD